MGFSEEEYWQFAQKVKAAFGIQLTEYKMDQMRRRLTTIAQQSGSNSFSSYFLEIRKNSEKLTAFLDHMTINVTELMRNADLFEDLAKSILPDLIQNRKGMPLSIWSAGCSYGAEAYTMAMLLTEKDPTLPFRIKGTDIDLAALAKANSAVFSKVDMNGVSEERRKKYFMQIDPNTFMPMPTLRRNVSFSKHDMLGEDYPTDQYDMILCRNVVIYFNDDAKDRIYRNFWKALKPGGILFVGGTERLNDAAGMNYKPIRPFFYRAEKDALRPALRAA